MSTKKESERLNFAGQQPNITDYILHGGGLKNILTLNIWH